MNPLLFATSMVTVRGEFLVGVGRKSSLVRSRKKSKQDQNTWNLASYSSSNGNAFKKTLQMIHIYIYLYTIIYTYNHVYIYKHRSP